MRARGLLFAHALIFLGLAGLAGCIYIPTFNAVGGKDASRKVGETTSKRPLRVDVATREQVVKLLGPPQWAGTDFRRIGYSWTTLKGLWVGLRRDAGRNRTDHRVVIR